MVLSDNRATAFAELAALAPDWNLRLGPPLLSPHQAYPGYLAGIFTGILKNAIPWVETWIFQIMGACAWLQVALLSGYRRSDATRAMHDHPMHTKLPRNVCTMYPIICPRDGARWQ